MGLQYKFDKCRRTDTRARKRASNFEKERELTREAIKVKKTY